MQPKISIKRPMNPQPSNSNHHLYPDSDQNTPPIGRCPSDPVTHNLAIQAIQAIQRSEYHTVLGPSRGQIPVKQCRKGIIRTKRNVGRTAAA